MIQLGAKNLKVAGDDRKSGGLAPHDDPKSDDSSRGGISIERGAKGTGDAEDAGSQGCKKPKPESRQKPQSQKAT